MTKEDEEDYKLAEERLNENNPKYSLEKIERVLEITEEIEDLQEDMHGIKGVLSKEIARLQKQIDAMFGELKKLKRQVI